MPVDGLALGVLDTQTPQVDELLAVHGWSAPEMAAWYQVGYQHDRLLRAAMRGGLADGQFGHAETESPLIGQGRGLMLAVGESLHGPRWWWMLLHRRDGAFSDQQRQLASLLLRHWAISFARPRESGLAQVILGHDDRIILADLATQVRLVGQADLLETLRRDFRPTVAQRYPDLADGVQRDLMVRIGPEPHWARFCRSRAVDLPGGEHWHLELRGVDKDDLPVVGILPDVRIAQALAFIHEHFAHCPSLTRIARTVHISPFHFHRLFSRQVGLSPKQYLQKYQLQVAKWMLRRCGVPIGQIAQATGFSSHGHFTSTFHRIVGLSPSEYREQA